MMKIPINHAIKSGAWFHAESKEEKFRVRVLSFEKVNLVDVDNPENLDTVKYNPSEGDFWLLKLQIINLNKRESHITPSILILDGEDFEFHQEDDSHLSLFSSYATSSGLRNYYGQSLIPKIKYTGAITFFLPKEDNAEYFITIREGNIQEL
jgi:hypothetical protein